MTPATGSDWISRRIRAAVGQRLLLGLAPSLLAVALVLALMYYGELGRQAPGYVVTGASTLALVSLVLTWWNTRYLVARLRRLGRDGAADAPDGPDGDEFDRIEREVSRLSHALAQSEREREQERERLERRLHEQATLLAATVRAVTAQVDEVRLPLHILFDTRFGDLNENQEELLAAARSASEQIDAAIRRLAIVADVDRDAIPLRTEPVAVNDVIRAVLPMVRATAEHRNVRVNVSLEPALPRAWANRAALAEALALLAALAIERIPDGEALELSTLADASHCAVRVAPAAPTLMDAPLAIVARRVLEVQGVVVSIEDAQLQLKLPQAMPMPTA